LTPTEGMRSDEVCTVMPFSTLEPLLPIANPLIVIVNTEKGLMDAPEIVIIRAVCDVALHTDARPETLLAPDATVGVTLGTKKLGG
jgi:hypothetical protein